MSTLPFLLEIGTEEIPDWMIPPALVQLGDLMRKLMDEHKLGGTVTWTEATTRRLALRADGLIERQSDSEELVMGPPKSAGAGAAGGFAKKMGVTVDALGTEATAKGEYFSFKKQVAGRATAEILASELPALIQKIQWPKTMYWTESRTPRFIRPVRWLVTLLGDQVLPVEFGGVRSGKVTRGHRILGKGSLPVTVDGYADVLRKNGVILSADDRRKKIRDEVASLLKGTGLVQRKDDGLLETLVFITECPTPILGEFEAKYLELPQEVLVTVMRHHQKYFSVETKDAKLAPRFIAVMNTSADPEGLVKRGNERVLRARFNDARFFWDFDQQKKLVDRVADLGHVTFQAKLGSYLEKTDRVKAQARAFARLAGADPDAVERAAMLAKCDLTTEMVKEFTDLQGVVGGLYARAQGETEEVAQAIYDHYKPVSMEGPIPSTLAGQLVSLADKIDTLRGCFQVGLIPTGSKDPFALRRAAQGVVKILVEGKLEKFALSKLLGTDAALREFMLDRIRYYFREVRGFKYDEVNAVLAAGWDNLVDVDKRLTALQAVRPTENFEPLAASFKRIANILRQADFKGGEAVDVKLLEPGAEQELYEEFQRVREKARASEYLPALDAIASIRPKADLFFDKVLVNAPDADVRRNRLTLLHQVLTEFSTIADFSEIVTQS